MDPRTTRTIARLPGTPGVYRFRDTRGSVLYIGRATALRRRVASYWSDLRERGHLAQLVTRIARIEAVTCDCFLVRGGRLCPWSQRGCSRSRAAPKLASTPAGWTSYAQRDAELAAALIERSG